MMGLLWPASLLWLLAACISVHASIPPDSAAVRKIPVSMLEHS